MTQPQTSVVFYVCGKDLVGKSLSAFCTSSLQNVSAVRSSHSFSETVLFLSLTLFGLVSSEHSGTSLIFGIGSVSDSNPMDAFYSDIVYYTPYYGFLSRVFLILGNYFHFSVKKPSCFGKIYRYPYLFRLMITKITVITAASASATPMENQMPSSASNAHSNRIAPT